MSFWGVNTTTAHPTRTPFVRDRTFIDTLTPAPDEFYDRTQEHLRNYYEAMLGRRWSAQHEELIASAYPTGFLGDLRIAINLDDAGAAGFTLAPVSPGARQGEHGVWSVLTGTRPSRLEMRGGDSVLAANDLLLSSRVKVVRRQGLSSLQEGGLQIGLSDPAEVVHPAFVAGHDDPNWHILSRQEENGLLLFWDTGIPVLDGRWYDLQISRCSGAVRFFINGAPCRLQSGRSGLIFVTLESPVDGFYLDGQWARVRRFLKARRWVIGPANDGFHIDNFHLFLQRST
jgi:hypothetical protein